MPKTPGSSSPDKSAAARTAPADSTQVKDRRVHGRRAATFDLQGAPAEGGTIARMVASNLSLGGLYCTSTSDYPEMTRLAVRLLLPLGNDHGSTEPVDAEAVVVRRQQHTGSAGGERYELALYFTRLEDQGRDQLRRYLDRRKGAGDAV